jgi:hypothetical protein
VESGGTSKPADWVQLPAESPFRKESMDNRVYGKIEIMDHEPIIDKPFECYKCKMMKLDLGARFSTHNEKNECTEIILHCKDCVKKNSKLFDLLSRSIPFTLDDIGRESL